MDEIDSLPLVGAGTCNAGHDRDLVGPVRATRIYGCADQRPLECHLRTGVPVGDRELRGVPAEVLPRGFGSGQRAQPVFAQQPEQALDKVLTVNRARRLRNEGQRGGFGPVVRHAEKCVDEIANTGEQISRWRTNDQHAVSTRQIPNRHRKPYIYT